MKATDPIKEAGARHNVKPHTVYWFNDCYDNLTVHKIRVYMEDALCDFNDANRHLTREQCEAYADEVCPQWRDLL